MQMHSNRTTGIHLHCKKILELRNNNLHGNIVLTALTFIYIDTDRKCYANRDNYFPAIHRRSL